MPGRKSTVPKVQRRSKTNPRKRSLNALAIATSTNPDDLKVRQHRLGETEGGSKARKQAAASRGGGHSSNSEFRADGAEKGQFGLDIDGGSDSEGNKWRFGQVGSDEDSDIDSDDAMGGSDEDKFEGFTFRGSSSGKHKGGLRRNIVQLRGEAADIDLEEPGEDNGSEPEDTDSSLGDDAIDLAAMLDASAEFEQQSKKRKTSLDEHDIATEESGSDDGEGDESMLSMSGDEEATDAAKLSALQNLISSLESSVQEPVGKRQRVGGADESRVPSEYGVGSSQKLTVADLLPSVTNHDLKKSLRIIAASDLKNSSSRTSIPSKLEIPLARRQQDRLDRNAANEKSKETLNRWVDTVKHNRRAEHLSFPLPDPSGEAASGARRLLPIAGSEPFNELESAIQAILQDSGLTTSNNKIDEGKIRSFEELQTNKMPLAEVEARRAQLRMARELLFREEVRAKRIKKIKSKSYRRVRRKQREKADNVAREALALAGVQTSDSEHNDRRRAEERMGARHREGKWAKAAKGSGRGVWDEDTRMGITEMARRGEELRRRIEGKPVGDADGSPEISSDDASDSDTNSSDSREGRSGEGNERRKLLRQLQKVGNSSHSSSQWPGGTSKLSSLKFMQKAEAARKAENDAAALNLQRELAGEASSDEEQISLVGRKKYGLDKPPKGTHVNGDPPNKLEDGSNSEGDAVVEIGLGVDINVKGSSETRKLPVSPRVSPRNGGSGAITKPKASTNPWTDQKEVLSRRRRQQRDEKADRKLPTGSKINPKTKASWTTPSSADSKLDGVIIDPSLTLKVPKPMQAHKKPTISSSGALRGANGRKPIAIAPGTSGDGSEDESLNIPISITDHELVERAFAGDDVVEEFEKEKRKTIYDEEEKIIDNTLPGWGSWTGAGVSKREEKRNRGKVSSKKEGIKEEKRRDAKLDRVIVNEKRVKRNAKYLASDLPHPFETREQYERSLRLPVGPEWMTKNTFQSATKPRVMVKQGRVIGPMCNPFM